MKRLITIALLALPCFAQSGTVFTKVYEVTASAAAVVSTLQQPSSPEKTVHLLGVTVYSSVAIPTVSFEAAGAASGSSTQGIGASPGDTTRSTAVHYAASNAAAASESINKFVLSAGGEKTLLFNIGRTDSKSNSILGRSPGQNFTIRTSSISGDVKVVWLWREE